MNFSIIKKKVLNVKLSKRSVNGQQILDEPFSEKKAGRARSGAQLSIGCPLPHLWSRLAWSPFPTLVVPKEGNESPPVPSGAHTQTLHPDFSSHPPNEFKAAGSCSPQAWMPVPSLPPSSREAVAIDLSPRAALSVNQGR